MVCGLDPNLKNTLLTNIRHKVLEQRPPTFLAPGTSFVEDNFSMDGGGGDGSGGNASDGEQWRAADEASLAHPPLTSCCAAQYRPAAPGLGTSVLEGLKQSCVYLSLSDPSQSSPARSCGPGEMAP